MKNAQVTTATVKQAAELLNVSTSGLYRKLRTGEVPGALKFGRKVLVDLDELIAGLRNPASREGAGGRP